MWERDWQSCHPTSKDHTASTTSSHNSSATQQNIKEVGRGWMRQKGWQFNKVETHGFFPHNQGLTSPTPYPLEPCPFYSTLHCRSWLWFILIDMRIYMMPNYNVPYSTAYHRQLSPLPKHTQPNRWWGFFLELLTMINYNIYIMQMGSKPGTLQNNRAIQLKIAWKS